MFVLMTVSMPRRTTWCVRYVPTSGPRRRSCGWPRSGIRWRTSPFWRRTRLPWGRPDSFWRERAAGAAEGVRERQQVVAVAPDGRWVGSVVVLVEEAGAQGALGDVSEVRQGHFVAVYVRPEVRGRGLTERLFAYALEWAWEVAGVERVRLFVDERNGRAEAFYRKFGFVPTGESVPVPGDPGARELEFVFKRS